MFKKLIDYIFDNPKITEKAPIALPLVVKSCTLPVAPPPPPKTFSIPTPKQERTKPEIPVEWQQILCDIEQSDEHFFITGQAGTGKSTLIRLYREITKKNVVVLAPTGLAAINAGGVTIHSFAHLPPRVITKDDVKELTEKALYRAIDTIIIDEVSMVRCDVLDGLDRFMRKNGRDKRQPFGGVQIILVGDPYQLSPVVKYPEKMALMQIGYPGPFYFWNSKIHSKIKPRKVVLTNRLSSNGTKPACSLRYNSNGRYQKHEPSNTPNLRNVTRF
jgi:hypothetical protein